MSRGCKLQKCVRLDHATKICHAGSCYKNCQAGYMLQKYVGLDTSKYVRLDTTKYAKLDHICYKNMSGWMLQNLSGSMLHYMYNNPYPDLVLTRFLWIIFACQARWNMCPARWEHFVASSIICSLQQFKGRSEQRLLAPRSDETKAGWDAGQLIANHSKCPIIFGVNAEVE